MNIILGIIITLVGTFVVVNLMVCVMDLGYVWEETHKGQKGLMDILDEFWKNFWRKIIKWRIWVLEKKGLSSQ
jgi:hypothetical protein